jgi:hypothetical protein
VTLDPNRLREVRTIGEVLEYLSDELDWPITTDSLEAATFDFSPEELGIPAERVPHLESLRQLRPITTNQPWGIFFLEFEGPRLPLTAVRRLLDRLVTKKRAAAGDGSRRTWGLKDLLFIIATSGGESVELHFVAFFDQPDGPPEIRSVPWRPRQSPDRYLARVASELLPHLAWPDDPADVGEWSVVWRQAFKLRHGEAIGTANALVDRMAKTARRLRDDIAAELDREDGDGPFNELMKEVREQLLASTTLDQFADMCAQTLVYGTLTSRITAPEAFGASPTLSTLPFANPFLGAFFEDVHDHAIELDLEADGLEQLVADLRISNVEAVIDQFGSTAKGGDPVIHLYEDFLAAYDAEMRIQAGAFYTPQPAVQFMVRLVDRALSDRIGLSDGLASTDTWGEVAQRSGLVLPGAIDPSLPFLSVLDPAVGTGTFLVEWIRRARAAFRDGGRDDEWAGYVVSHLLPQMHAFEIMLAPYAVAHLKVALELHDGGIEDQQLGILLTDTLQRSHTAQLSFEPDAISVEGERADDVKFNERVTVCIGNPPYDRVTGGASGGWITEASAGRSLFDDVLDPAREYTVFSHHAALYNKFVYFWRWAMWKVFEDRPDLPGVIAFITPSSWLTGPGFVGLRQLVRQHCDEVWVVDLAGDNRGTRRDENIFDIETPVAIVVGVRSGSGDQSTSATVRYQRVEGTRAEKLLWLAESTPSLGGNDWLQAESGWFDRFIPPTGDIGWGDYPELRDLFPWQQPGCMLSRTWPICPDPETLERRWSTLLEVEDIDERASRFVTPANGRNVRTSVAGLPRIAELPPSSLSRPIVRYGYRSFDRQWTFMDPRLAKTESPSLWASLSESQIFLASMITKPLGNGPAATLTTFVPDKDFFCGRGGKDIIPLFRDSKGTPNVSPGTLETISLVHKEGDSEASPVSLVDLFAYCYAVLSGSDYTHRFAKELETPGPRLPITADPVLFRETVELGKQLVWLSTFGDRFAGEGASESVRREDVVVVREINRLPTNARSISYDPDHERLTVGDGEVARVSREVWSFEVSGMPILKKWLGYRTATPPGRAATSGSILDRIRPSKWLESWTEELLDLVSVLQSTIDLVPRGTHLLDDILAGPLISASEFPPVPESLRRVPVVSMPGGGGFELED